MQIAIDGPAGSGKSTLARLLAKEMGFTYIDTASMYRAVTLLALENGITATEDEKLKALLSQFELTFLPSEITQEVFIGKRKVTEAIREERINQNVARFAQNPLVRAYLSDYQREMAKQVSVVMDGRDIGTVILPFASVKFFLSASPEERARRRSREQKLKGYEVEYETILEEIKKRDELDKNR